MRNYEERAKDFIKEIFPLFNSFDNYWDASDAVEMFNRLYNRKVIANHGCARIALITSDYVVKFDYDQYEVRSVGGCENEIKLYEQAEKDGFAYLFAKITRYTYKGQNFYIMPRINGVGSDDWNYADDHMTEEENNWCDRHDLTDLHNQNYGFRNGHVCIIDYACRRWYSDSSSSSSSKS